MCNATSCPLLLYCRSLGKDKSLSVCKNISDSTLEDSYRSTPIYNLHCRREQKIESLSHPLSSTGSWTYAKTGQCIGSTVKLFKMVKKHFKTDIGHRLATTNVPQDSPRNKQMNFLKNKQLCKQLGVELSSGQGPKPIRRPFHAGGNTQCTITEGPVQHPGASTEAALSWHKSRTRRCSGLEVQELHQELVSLCQPVQASTGEGSGQVEQKQFQPWGGCGEGHSRR